MNATRKNYQAPALSANGEFVVETRKGTQGDREIDDVKPEFPAGSVGFGL